MPNTQREAAYALGATRWEAIQAALRFGRTGIIGAVILGFGRALGETMAVTMVIGNNPQIRLSLFAPQYTMAAVIANEFTEAADDLYLSALIEIGLVLFIITVVINAVSRLLIWSVTREKRVRVPKPASTMAVGGAGGRRAVNADRAGGRSSRPSSCSCAAPRSQSPWCRSSSSSPTSCRRASRR